MASSAQTGAAAPSIGASQLDAGSLGDISNSVNLFRGDVDFPLKFLSLTGAIGLDVPVAALYGSNVHRQVSTWNMEAPTDVLGVGWSMPFARIVVEGQRTGSNSHDAFYLISSGGVLPLVEAGPLGAARSFQLASYQFWQITYFQNATTPELERWEIRKEDGTTYVYGLDGIQWGVRWANWIGASANASGQPHRLSRYPLAWNLVEARNQWGQRVRFQYTNTEIPIGGDQSSSYTRESLLGTITGHDGTTVSFTYKLKSASEIQLPYVPPSPASPNAFQFQYAQHLLDTIDLRSDKGDLLLTTSFAYQAHNVAPPPNDKSDHYTKSYLHAVTQQVHTGASLPGVVFEYFTDPSDVNPGALRSITYPGGGTATYQFASARLAGSSTRRAIEQPALGFSPLVWHGPDYTIVCWYSEALHRARLTLYMWNGTWVMWQADDLENVDLADLNVIPASGFFTVYYRDVDSGTHQVWLYHTDEYRLGTWSAHKVPPAQHLGEVAVTAGRDFIAVTSADATTPAGEVEIQVVQWSGLTREWTYPPPLRFSPGTRRPQVALYGAANFLFAACYDQVGGGLLIRQYFADAAQWWDAGISDTVQLDPSVYVWQPGKLLGLGDGFASLTHVTAVDGDSVYWNVRIYQWREDFTSYPVQEYPFSQPVSSNPIDYSIVSGDLIGNANNLFRYDGEGFVRGTMQVNTSDPGIQLAYAYGADRAIAAQTADGSTFYSAMSFDPYDCRWSPDAMDDLPSDGQVWAGLPTISGSYCTIGRRVYYRTPTLDWEPVCTLPTDCDPGTIQNRGPSFISCEQEQTRDTYVLLFKDGAPTGQPHLLPDQHVYVPDAGTGELLVGGTSFVTYEGDSLDEATALHLYRVVDGSIDDMQTDLVVSSLTTTDGYGDLTTYYDYDTDTATYDPYGLVAQYGRATTLKGDHSGGQGRTENLYFNGLNPATPHVTYPPTDAFTNVRDFYSLFNGQLFTATTYDGEGQEVARLANYYYAYDAASNGPGGGGTYTRLRKRTESSFPFAFDLDQSFAVDLDDRTFTPDLRMRFQEEGFAVSPGVTVTIELPDRRWTIADAEGRFIVSRAPTVLRVSCEVTDVSEMEYNARGQPSKSVTRNVDSRGDEVWWSEETTYGWQVYPDMTQLNLLTPVVQNVTANQTAGVTTGVAVTTYVPGWGTTGAWGPHKAYVWDGTPGTERFDFAAWSGGGEPSTGWLRTAETIAFTSTGLVIEATDIDGLPSSVLYDRGGRFAVARFSNASITGDEASYYGFEEYEADQGWGPSGSTQVSIVPGDAYTGTRCLRLAGDPSQRVGLQRTFRPANGAQRFLLSCYVKTGPAFDPSRRDAGWEVTYTGPASGGGPEQIEQSIFVPLPATDATWTHFHHVLDPAQLGVESFTSLGLLVFNGQAGTDLLVDDISFAPFLGQCEATVFEKASLLQTAEVDMLGSTRRIAYDHLLRPVVEVGNDLKPKSLMATYLWRQYGDPFDAAHPNSTLGAVPRTGGLLEDFHQGREWERRWQVSPGWSVQDQRLVFAGGEDGTVALRDADEYHNYGVRLKVSLDEVVSRPLGIRIGDSISVRWNAGSWELSDLVNHRVVDSFAQPGLDAHDDLVLIATDHRALFYVNGRLVLQSIFSRAISGAPKFFAGSRLTVEYIVVFTDPLPTVTYFDNADQLLQAESVDDTAVLVSANCSDALDRVAINTRTARFAGAPVAYRPGFVRTIDWTTGVMTGEISDQYPDDEGYPYSRMRFEDSPLSRTVETSAPGRLFAIDLTVPASERHTSQYARDTNVAGTGMTGFVSDLPAGEYTVARTLNQDKVPSLRITDKAGNVVARQQGDPLTGSCTEMRNVYDDYGNLQTVKLPNAFQVDGSTFEARMTYDFLGRMVSKTTPDAAGPSSYVYDRANRVRFMRDANGEAEGYILYWLYDSIGRMTEKGTCVCPWNRSELQEHADEEGWLPVPGIWSKRYHYDGDGSDPNLIGRLWTVQANNGALTPKADVEETFSYDAGGKVTRKSVRVPAYDGGVTHTLRYRYDNAGNTTATTYDDVDSGTQSVVGYEFNHLGDVSSVTEDSTVYARFTYNPDMSIASATRRPGTGPELLTSYTYGLGGWLTRSETRSQGVDLFSEELSYTSGGYEGGGYYTGKIARQTCTFGGIPEPDGFVTAYSYRYRYGQLGRMEVAWNDRDSAWSLGAGQPIAYDPNGNVHLLTRGTQREEYEYEAGTDRLINTMGDPRLQAYGYNPNGNLVRADPRGITGVAYDRSSQMSTSVAVAGDDVSFAYDGGDRRVLKRAAGEVRLYVLGLDGSPVIERTRSQRGTEAINSFIYGPSGLLAIRRDGHLFDLVRDHDSSTRLVFDGQRVISAYNYTPFGDFMGASFQAPGAPSVTSYLFTGQELDVEPGLYNYNARFYDSYLGRFYSVDPAGEFASPYIYAGDDPIDFNDPTGEWSWAAFGAILGGIALAAAGGALIFFSGGIAAALVAPAWAAYTSWVVGTAVVVGSMALGAGVSSAAYGAMHTKEGSFNVREWGAMTGLGGAFGGLSGGAGLLAGLAVAAGSSGLALAIDVGAGMVIGGIDGFVTNGVINDINHESFTKGWVSAAAFGALGGGAGGLLGRGTTAGAARTARAGAGAGRIEVSIRDKGGFVSHSGAGIQPTGKPMLYFDLVSGGRPFGTQAQIRAAAGLNPARWGPTYGIAVPQANAANAANYATGMVDLGPANWPNYNLLTNNCVTFSRQVLTEAGLPPPQWARTAVLLSWWFRWGLGAR